MDFEPDWDLAAQPVPDFEVDQRIKGSEVKAATPMRCGVSLRAANPMHRTPLSRPGLFRGEPAWQGIDAGAKRSSSPQGWPTCHSAFARKFVVEVITSETLFQTDPPVMEL